MKSLRVLLVDDEEDLVNTMVERLNLRGIDAQGALSGDQALDRLAEREYDVAVIDLKMPGMSGEELLAKVRSQYPAMRIILITGHGAIREGEEAAKDGAFDYLVKPFDLETLIDVMKQSTDSP